MFCQGRVEFKKSERMSDFLNRNRLDRLSYAIELPEFSAGFRLLAALFHTGFLVVFPAFQLSFDTIDLQFLLQLSYGVLKITTNFNFYHLGLRLANNLSVFE